MKKKINILFILCFILLLCSCGRTYAVEINNDIVKEYCKIVYNKEPNNLTTLIYNVINSIEFEDENINFENYEAVRIWVYEKIVQPSWTSEVGFQFFNTTPKIKIISLNQIEFLEEVEYTEIKFTITNSNSGIIRISVNEETNNTVSKLQKATNITSTLLSYNLVNDITNNNNYKYYGWNYYYSILTRGSTGTITEKNQPYPIADAYVGNNYNDLNYNIYYISNEQKIYYTGQITTVTTPTNDGNTMTILINKDGVLNGQTYFIEIESNDSILATTPTGITLYTSNVSEETNSGDKDESKTDLTQTNNKIEEVKQEVNKQGENIVAVIESGEKKAEERNNYWKEQFDNLFTLNSGDINELVADVEEKIKIPSGEITDITMVLDYLNGQPEDFIISWQNFNPEFTYNGEKIKNGNGKIIKEMGNFIKSGNINFSQMERDNEQLQRVMSYTRIILTISIAAILLREYYITILAILGVNIAIYGNETEHKEKLNKQAEEEKRKREREERNREREEKNRYNQWLYEHRRPKK